jgi:2-polyprenyl-3-methyl-5-hydroxy-6-metoxy-1,4-benzoquinol methylase
MDQTQVVQAYLPNVFRRYDVEDFIDAPCGDCNWMQNVNLNGVAYTGYDIDRRHINAAKARGINWNVLESDILVEDFPHADMLLCRHCLQHWRNEEILKFLQKLFDSGITYLLATSSRNLRENVELPSSEFRTVNLELPPFGLPAPIEWIDDGPAQLCLWKL